MTRRLRPASSSRVVRRAAFTRTNADLLTGGAGYTTWDGGREGPGIDPSGVPPVHWMGLDSGGGAYPIGPNGPWTNGYGPAAAVVTRATSLITSPLSVAPYRVLSEAPVGEPVPVPAWIRDPMLLREDARITSDVYPAAVKLPRSEFWAAWIRAAVWWGVGGFLCQEDVDGQPLAGTMRLVNPALLSTERANDGSLRWVLGDPGGGDRAVLSRDGRITLGTITYRLVTLRNPHSTVDAEGHSMGVFEMSPGAFQLTAQVASYGHGVFRSGVPAGFLRVTNPPNMTSEQADELRRRWMAHHGGDRRSIAVLSAGVDFTPLNFSPVDAALGEVTRLNIADVAFAFGLSPENMGVSLSGSATYGNVRDHFQDMKDFGISAWIAALQDTLTALLPGTAGVVVNLDGFANPPMSERVSTGVAAVGAGLMTVDEWRDLEGLPPMPEEARPEPVPEAPPQLQAVPEPPPEPPPPPPPPEQNRNARPPALRRGIP